MSRAPTVTFDVYSALVDSRTGGSTALAELFTGEAWPPDPEAVFVAWDRRNKTLHRTTTEFVGFRALAHRAMRELFDDENLPGDPVTATDHLLASLPDWPLWPDADAGVRQVARRHPVALLSNIDDDLLRATDVCSWVEDRLTSEQARVYKPHAGLYLAARARFGDDLIHVPASSRDTRGALEAGLSVVRVRRPGHELDPSGPRPTHEVDDLRDLPDVLARLTAARGPRTGPDR
ncbi:haloacid dehalogenase [Egicoccus sp. AB-alg6-2]|uniref:haloacid dehalogenase n=1 Tax=Egicoccus sp. AB-alg6-2 TaxID=3242692 RepID=UPI00359DCE16